MSYINELKEARKRMLEADSQAEADRWFGRILALIDELPTEAPPEVADATGTQHQTNAEQRPGERH